MLKVLVKEKKKSSRKLSVEDVAAMSGLSVNTIRAYTTRGRIKSRQIQPGIKGSKRYFLESEVFDTEGNLVFQEV